MNIGYFIILLLRFWLIVGDHFRNRSQLLHQSIRYVNDVVPAVVLSFLKHTLELCEQDNLSYLILAFVISSDEGADGVAEDGMEGVLLIVVQLGSVEAVEGVGGKRPFILAFHDNGYDNK